MNTTTKVLLPRWIWGKAANKQEFMQIVIQYMRTAYPDYQIKKVENGFAICERGE